MLLPGRPVAVVTRPVARRRSRSPLPAGLGDRWRRSGAAPASGSSSTSRSPFEMCPAPPAAPQPAVEVIEIDLENGPSLSQASTEPLDSQEPESEPAPHQEPCSTSSSSLSASNSASSASASRTPRSRTPLSLQPRRLIPGIAPGFEGPCRCPEFVDSMKRCMHCLQSFDWGDWGTQAVPCPRFGHLVHIECLHGALEDVPA